MRSRSRAPEGLSSATPATRLALWVSLALLAVSACAEGVTSDASVAPYDEDEEEGGDWSPPPIESTDDGASSPSGAGAGGGPVGSSGSASGGGCGVGEHFCGGLCAGNTPETGCAQSTSCEPCVGPEHSSPTCNEAGACELACDDGYFLADDHCACASECCTSLDCENGYVCEAGSCQPPPCYPLECIGACFLQLKCGGICVGTTCTCFPCPS